MTTFTVIVENRRVRNYSFFAAQSWKIHPWVKQENENICFLD